MDHTPPSNETIAAVATPPGEGGVAIIRISGPDAIPIAESIFSKPLANCPSHVAQFGRVLGADQSTIDEALALIMRAPKSYTGEDTVEIHCHGGSLITQQVLQTTLTAGARLARPGEFTFKAFLNGKIDLSQAEAVQQLICAKNTLATHAAKNQLAGKLSEQIRSFQQELTEIAAVLEAWVDFPEEGLEFMSLEEVLSSLGVTLKKIQALRDTFSDGKMIEMGVALCLAGPPNAGKSSLMNALLGKEQAIVTDIPGTTRDVLEAHMHWGDLHFRLLDTAGIRETQEVIEQEGIRRSKESLKEADLILLVLDACKSISSTTEELIQLVPAEKTLFVWNKIDKQGCTPLPSRFLHAIELSAKHHTNFDELKSKVHSMLYKGTPPSKEEVLITSSRHHESLCKACHSLESLIRCLQEDVSAEFASSDMRQTLNHLAEIIGTNVTEDILSAIFSKFCVGK